MWSLELEIQQHPEEALEQIKSVLQNLNAFSFRRKIGLLAAVAVSVVTMAVIVMMANKPAQLPLYGNLTREDVNSISRVLAENGMAFTVGGDGGTVSVAPAMVANARMLLAEQGLPSSQESGYELFDKMNTLGLTSFMQDVTNKRAIEGELARTIRMINGVNSARVHLVFREKNIYRRKASGAPTASIVLKSNGLVSNENINAIRHLVAAAVPGLDSNNVTVVGANGGLLSSVDDESVAGTTKLVELEREFENDMERKILLALQSHLGEDNLRVTVSAKLNSDKKRIDETQFDPDSRVERSVQVSREIDKSQNKDAANPVSVTENLPDEPSLPGNGQTSEENSERREELTNFEINQKKISVVSDGYKIETLAVSLVVNRKRIEELLGETPDPVEVEAKIAELREIVSAVVASSEERGDLINVSFVEFLPQADGENIAADGGLLLSLGQHFGSLLQFAGLVLSTLLVVFLGIRPLIKLVGAPEPAQDGLLEPSGEALLLDGAREDAQPDPANTRQPEQLENNGRFNLAKVVERETSIREALKEMVEENEERAARALKKWLEEETVEVTR